MAIKPAELERQDIRKAIAAAVRKRAPQDGNLDAWYWKVQEGSGVGRDTIRALCRDEVGPATDTVNFYRVAGAGHCFGYRRPAPGAGG